MDLKRSEDRMLSEVKELREKMESLSKTQVELQKEADDLRRQLRESEKMVSKLQQK